MSQVVEHSGNFHDQPSQEEIRLEPSPFEVPPKVVLVRQQVTDAIRGAITQMRLMPGDRLTERELMEWSGVSRATVREAIRQLEADRLVIAIPQRGVEVRAPSPQEAAELYEIRAVLEGLTGRQCAENATVAQVKTLRRSFEAMRKSADAAMRKPATDGRQRGVNMVQVKAQFYEALFAGAGNETVKEILSGLQARITVLRSISMAQPGRLTATVEEVGKIVEAIEARDPDAAAKACEAHVRAAGAIALGALKTTPLKGQDKK
jgi:GntR family transcriptional regulator, trigonelline degradation regulator